MSTLIAMSHDQLAHDLAEHLRGGSKRVTWENMQLGPSGSPRPDVYTMEPTYTRLTFEAFEVKVSTSDFRSDVTSGKWQSYLRYANSVTFAVPAGLVDKSAVPASCGLIVRGPGGWRYVKKPVRQQLTEIPWQAWIKLLLDGTERANLESRAAYWSEWSARNKLAKKFGDKVAEMLSDLPALATRYENELALHRTQLAALNNIRREHQEQVAADRKAAAERCSGAVARLACALGLPADAVHRDLDDRCGQLLELLQGQRGRWGRHPMVNLADEMEALAKRMRECGQTLAGASAGQQKEAA